MTSSRTPPLPFTAPDLLAPMEGVTEPCFRDLVLARNDAGSLGGTFTEFARVTDHPIPAPVLRRHLGARDAGRPVGLQLMGNEPAAVAETAVTAVDEGVPLLDLNFGCPARGTVRGCAGSALLREPRSIEGIVAACVRAVNGAVPVTAKIRAGFDDDARLEELARAVEAGGAALLTVHCRTRTEGYRDDAVDWTRISRAVAAVTIPVCGNGGIETHADLARMRRETGAAFSMAGRGALRDPWIFAGHRADAAEARAFLRDYLRGLVGRGFAERAAVDRLKQLVTHLRAGGLFADPATRRRWLSEKDPAAFAALLEDGPPVATAQVRVGLRS